ncbi:MAG: PilZ domain-containing protein [Methylococcaceae bacterium]
MTAKPQYRVGQGSETEQKQHLKLDKHQLMSRRFRRVYLHQYLDVIDSHNNELLGYLSDFSTTGLMFISHHPIARQSLKTICINNNFVEQAIRVHAKIETLWVKPNINPSMHCIGCRFHGIDAYNRKLLEHIGNTLSFPEEIEIAKVKQY